MKRKGLLHSSIRFLVLLWLCQATQAQDAGSPADGGALYDTYCAACHEDPNQDPRMPRRQALGSFSPNHVVGALTDGLMRSRGRP